MAINVLFDMVCDGAMHPCPKVPGQNLLHRLLYAVMARYRQYSSNWYSILAICDFGTTVELLHFHHLKRICTIVR